MTILDAIEACSCEHNPNRQLMAGTTLDGAGSTWDFAERLSSLREVEVAEGAPLSFECMRILLGTTRSRTPCTSSVRS